MSDEAMLRPRPYRVRWFYLRDQSGLDEDCFETVDEARDYIANWQSRYNATRAEILDRHISGLRVIWSSDAPVEVLS